jgi:hypothetical protein
MRQDDRIVFVSISTKETRISNARSPTRRVRGMVAVPRLIFQEKDCAADVRKYGD